MALNILHMSVNTSEASQKCPNVEIMEWVGSSGTVGFLLLKCEGMSLGFFRPALMLPWWIPSG